MNKIYTAAISHVVGAMIAVIALITGQNLARISVSYGFGFSIPLSMAILGKIDSLNDPDRKEDQNNE